MRRTETCVQEWHAACSQDEHKRESLFLFFFLLLALAATLVGAGYLGSCLTYRGGLKNFVKDVEAVKILEETAAEIPEETKEEIPFTLEKQELAIGGVDEENRNQIPEVSQNGGSETKVMYLTFDDGPSAENTDKILDILKERKIKATFFLVGENVEKRPEVARRIVREGHAIGIHCYSHDYKSIYASVDSYVEDFRKAWQAVKDATGVEAKFFRFPGGSINAYNKGVYREIAREMTARGYIYFDWNASLEDAVSHPKADQLVENALSSTLGRRKIIMLAHDTVSETTQCLDRILDGLSEYQAEPLTEEVAPIQFKR